MATAPSPQGGQSWVKWLVIAIAVIVVGSGAWYAWGYFGAKGAINGINSMNDGVGKETDNPAGSGRPEGLTVDIATPAQFYNDEYFTDADRVAWADAQLKGPSNNPNYPNMTVEQAAYDQINANLAKSNGLQLGKEFSGLVAPSISNTPQEVDTQQYVGLAAVMFEPDLDKAKKLLAAVDDYGSESHTNMTSDIVGFRSTTPSLEAFYGQTLALYYTPWDKNSNPLKPQATGVSSSSNEPLGAIYPIDGTPTRVVMQRVSQDADRPHSPDFEVVYTFVGGKRWVQQQTIRPGDDKWIPPDQLVGIHSD